MIATIVRMAMKVIEAMKAMVAMVAETEMEWVQR